MTFRQHPGWFVFSRIVLVDGTELLFNPHLNRYTEFVDELRRRVTARVVDPYPAPAARWSTSTCAA